MIDFQFTSDFVRIIRKTHRMSLAELAEALQLSVSYVHAIEKQREPMTDNVRRKLIESFDLTPEKLQRIEHDFNKYTFKGRSDG